MPNLIPHSGSVLAPGIRGAPSDAPGVILTPRHDLALAAVIARRGKAADLSQKAMSAFGVELPPTPRWVDTGAIAFVWAGPGHWLALSEHRDGATFERMLRQEFHGLAAVIDQSDGRSVIGVSGPQARAALAKGVPLDLDARVFSTGDAALSLAGHINVHFWQCTDAPAYELAVFRSFFGAFCDWLLQAAAEFGVLVSAPQ